MRAGRTTVALLAASFPVLAAACVGAGDDTLSVAPLSGAASAEGGAADATTDGQDGTAATPNPSHMETNAPTPAVAGIRVANWSSHAPPIDLCVAKHGTGAFRGPMLGTFVKSGDDAGADGGAALSFPYASAYSYVAPGQYDGRLVVAGASDCSAGIGADVTNLPTLLAGGYATIALIGEASPAAGAPGLQLIGLLDDAFADTGVGLRFINAVPSAALTLADFGEGSGGGFAPLFLAVHFGQAGTAAEAKVSDAAPPPVDPYGYASIAALSSATLSLRARNGAQDLATATDVNVAAGAVVTIVAVGLTELVECVDNAGTLSYLGACGIISAGGDAGTL